MLSNVEYVKQSLGFHLFFARIMKEHSFFLEVGFSPRDANFTQQADGLRREFDAILGETISLACGVVNPEILLSGEIVTRFTLNAEIASTYFTGVQIPIHLTQAELGLVGGNIITVDPVLEQRVYTLNNRAINALTALIQFKKNVLSNVLSCKMFTFNYPSLIEHIIREAELYLVQINRLQNRERIDTVKEACELELFWGRQMVDHLEFIRGLLDPTEERLINRANSLIDQSKEFGSDFNQLMVEARTALDATIPPVRGTNEKLRLAKEIRNFKALGTEGILACQIKSIIIPLLGDHVLREANHYLRILKICERGSKIPPVGRDM